MAELPEVVMTGMGIVSPIAVGAKNFWNALSQGQSGVGPLQRLGSADLPVPFGAEIIDFEPKQYVKPRKSLKVMSWEIQLGFSAAVLALQEAQIAEQTVNPNRFGVVLGSEMMYCPLSDFEDIFRSCIVDGQFHFDLWDEKAMNKLFPLWLLKYLPNMTACHIGISVDARGPCNTITLGESSSLLSLQESARIIQRGAADVMLCGGSGSRLSLTALCNRGEANLSHRSDNPAAASRPFDLNRDGMVNGEGGGTFILESRAHAERRGANILARILGFGNAYGVRPDGQYLSKEAIVQSIEKALRESSLEPSDIGHVNANGFGTKEHDALEAQAIHHCLGETPVTAPKSFFGNLGAGTGAIEMAASVLAFEAGETPFTLNYETPDADCPVNVVCKEPLKMSKKTALILNQSGTGQAVAVVIAAP